MTLNPQRIAPRDKLILAGLYLSKFDAAGLKRLGFASFIEAFNVLGYGLGGKPASIKNYRDEFDPLFPNRRKGWHRRQIRNYCLKIYEEYKDVNADDFTFLVKSLLGYNESVWSEVRDDESKDQTQSLFAKRLITGLAAENYFESVHPRLPEFNSYSLENTTRLGCGYDFRLRTARENDFLAVEVKGLRETTGNLSLTPKEYQIARDMAGRFYLFVVKNFQEDPFHEIYQNPLSGALRFTKRERTTIQISWLASV